MDQPSMARCFLARIAAATLALAALAGCIPIPFVDSEPAPAVAVHVPGDLRSSDAELLILVQATRGHESARSRIIDEPTFTKGREVAEATRNWSRTRTIQWALIVCGGFMACGGIPLTERPQRLDRLCMIAQDGRTVTLESPTASEWTGQREGLVTSASARSIAAALRGEQEAILAAEDAPCGISGAVDWARETRGRVAAFLERIADRSAAGTRLPDGGAAPHATR